MHIGRLRLLNFRNYVQGEIALSTGAHLFLGRNGQGKTNLVESVIYAATGSSHRTSETAALIRDQEDTAVVDLTLTFEERRVTVQIEINRHRANRVIINGNNARMGEIPRYLSTVLFAPEDQFLIRGEPQVRRRFLNELGVQLHPRMAAVLADYDKALKQRNTLLRSLPGRKLSAEQRSTLEVWNDQIARFGSMIIAARRDAVSRIAARCGEAYAMIAGDSHSVAVEYLSSVTAEPAAEDADLAAVSTLMYQTMQRIFPEIIDQEVERGSTLIGPHRDDLTVILNGLPARGYSSHGESWSLALALKLASADVLRETSLAGDPILILDDVFAELDAGRRDNLVRAIDDFEQVLITAADIHDIPGQLEHRVWQVDGGKVSSADE